MGRLNPDKQDKQNKTPIKTTTKQTQNITPQVANATTNPGDNASSIQEEQDKETYPTTKFKRNPADDPYHNSHAKHRFQLRIEIGKEKIDAEGDIADSE
jgi:hypothetical protein